jgi:hypothetical protein
MTDYADLIYRLGQRYSRELRAVPRGVFPRFSGQLCDLGIDPLLLPQVEGEYTIAFTDSRTNHTLHVYIEAGGYTVQGAAGLHQWGVQADVWQG